MTMDDEKFFAWLDDELDDAAAARVAAQVAVDPELQRRAAAHNSMQARLGDAFAPIAAAPIPATIFASTERGMVVDLAAARVRRSPRLGLPAMAQWAAMAATLVLGLVTGSMLDRGSSSPIESQSGQLLASAGLARALDTRLASAPAATGPRIGLTFRGHDGTICRSFTDVAAQGLACRDGQDWRIRGLFQGTESATGDYRMAAGADPNLAALVDATRVGDAFDATQERQALTRDWR